MAKKKAAKKRSSKKRVAKKKQPNARGEIAGGSWAWFESKAGGAFSARSERDFSIAVSFPRSVSVTSATLNGDDIVPRADGDEVFVRCAPGDLNVEVSWDAAPDATIAVSDWDGP